MLVMTMDGPQLRCAACGVLLTEGLALFRPLKDQADRADVLTVCSKACAKGELISVILPVHSSRPLRSIVSQLEETVGAEVTHR